MSEADRVFSTWSGQGAQATPSERRFISSTTWKGGPGGNRTRMVEVVHVRRSGAGPAEGRSQAASCEPPAAAWLEGFRAKPAQPIPPPETQPATPEAPPPVTHVLPMWQPLPPQAVPPVEAPPAAPIDAAAPRARKPRLAKGRAPKAMEQRFADPFADGEDGTNCMRCGYLVEVAREQRGLLTCSACG
jgi:hypothetical protein